MEIEYREVESPVGILTIGTNGRALVSVYWENDRIRHERSDHPLLIETDRQLREYFAGARTSFDIPVEPSGTEFQRSVWKALQTIPYAGTVSYGHIARSVGSPKAVRAVGAANGRNPISIVIPCHRVIGADGTLTGFGGGLEAKKLLLELEARVLASRRAA